ncbi:MAG: hypothetical protein A2406_00050 [Candidatus Komeilibacteria bacterium RIFOXYC1_FULL_37_11]|uniref:DUF2079 domain-containing protein n=1 Tax=Candidatus Komeilibacteria bacterium RIFOXYC1_FULL_37_11 TaxID=1798555 RepID=A0A1G2BYE2_9BACT|nr:MAG: hypothetical protein A2406_00050 [Candidatus Komeilibacteria bacterium RIFOXYC1_FULL_37_11]OGY95131.1 MAG: hypothetical protein A2611_00255 [Candidatus Komeilibacteria bacterium RIFOXYD1_FULL_37_29]
MYYLLWERPLVLSGKHYFDKFAPPKGSFLFSLKDNLCGIINLMIEIFSKYGSKFLVALMGFYACLFSWLSWKKYYNFHYNIFDLAIFNQVFYNTTHGRWFEMTFNLHNYLADHFSPIILGLLPFYWLWQSPQNLLIIQSIVLALSGWPIYLISQQVIGQKNISLIIVCLWFLNFILHNGNLYEFHLLSLAVFFVLWAFYFYQKNNFKIFFLFFVLALLVREDIFLSLLGFSILSCLDKKDYRWRLAPLLGILYFLGALKIVSFFNLETENKFLLYYGWLGGDDLLSILWAWGTNFWLFLAHLFSLDNFISSLIILVSVGFLPLLAPRYLWLLFFPLLQFLFTSTGLNSVVYSTHYGLIFLPGLFVASIFAWKNILSKKKFIFSSVFYNNLNFFKVLFIVTIFYFFIFLSPIKNILFAQGNLSIDNNLAQINKILSPSASLVVSESLAAAFSSRQAVYPFQYSYMGRGQFYLEEFNFPEVDYILIDTNDIFETLAYVDTSKVIFNKNFEQNIPKDFRERLDNYILIFARNNLLLWQNKTISQDKDALLLYKFIDNPDLSDNSSLISGFDYSFDSAGSILNLTYQKTQLLEHNYLLRFYAKDYYFDVPLDYGLWPQADWPEDKLGSFYYYLNPDITAYQIFSWQGEVALGRYRQAEVDFNLREITPRLEIDGAL